MLVVSIDDFAMYVVVSAIGVFLAYGGIRCVDLMIDRNRRLSLEDEAAARQKSGGKADMAHKVPVMREEDEPSWPGKAPLMRDEQAEPTGKHAVSVVETLVSAPLEATEYRSLVDLIDDEPAGAVVSNGVA